MRHKTHSLPCSPLVLTPISLSQAKSKASDAITAIDAEMCYNVGVNAQLNAKEASTLAW